MKTFEVVQQELKNLALESDVIQNQKITETLLPIISNLIPEKLEQSGAKIVKNIAPILKESSRLAEITTSILSKFDTDYITKYGDTIINDLQKINNKSTSFGEKVKSVFTGKDYLKGKIEKLIDSHISENNKHIKDKITIFSKALTNTEIVAGLTRFINENKVKENPEFKNINPNEIQNNKSALVELRKINPRGFDKMVFEDSKHSTSNSKAQQIEVEPPITTPHPPTNNQSRRRG